MSGPGPATLPTFYVAESTADPGLVEQHQQPTWNPGTMMSGSSLQSLQRAFRDPSSPFYLREGEIGPASPDEIPRSSGPDESQRSLTPDITSFSAAAAEASTITSLEHEAAEAARAYALSQGHDPDSFYEQKVVWGDLDSFRHVNNTRYVRFLESSRIHWLSRLGEEAGGPAAAENLLAGKGIGLILKSISVNFKRPVRYPDTLLISHRPHAATPPSPTHFHNAALIYSYAQGAVVATSDSVLVWYDYDQLKKAPPTKELGAALERRMQRGDQS